MFRNVSIYGKAGLALGAILVFLIVIGIVSVNSVATIGEEVSHVARRDIVLQDNLARVRNNISTQNATIVETLLEHAVARSGGAGGTAASDETLRQHLAANRAAFDEEDRKIAARLGESRLLLTEGAENAAGEGAGEEEARFREQLASMDEIARVYGTFAAESRRAFDALAAGDVRAAVEADDRVLDGLEARLHGGLTTLANGVKAGTEQSLLHVQRAESAARTAVITITFVAVIVGLIATFLVARAVIVPLTRAGRHRAGDKLGQT